MWTGLGWPFGRSARSLTHTLSWDVLITRYCMFIKPSHCYKQENAIVPSRAETQVALRQWTEAHFSTVSQWDRRKHMAAEWKLAWLSSDVSHHPVAQSPVVGHTGSGECGEEKRLGFTKIFSHLLSEQLHPPSHSPSRSLISHAIDWNPKRQDQAVRNPAFLWIVDWMWWWCGVLFL